MAMSADEILKIKSNPELEAEYRRGYLDGFYAVIQALPLIGRRRGKVMLENIMESFWFENLQVWKNMDLDRIVLPPDFFTKCVYCGGEATQIDHVIPRSRGGTDEVNNLVPCCQRCNISKSNRTPEEWTRRNRVILPGNEK